MMINVSFFTLSLLLLISPIYGQTNWQIQQSVDELQNRVEQLNQTMKEQLEEQRNERSRQEDALRQQRNDNYFEQSKRNHEQLMQRLEDQNRQLQNELFKK